jgi:hypothetical protein
MTTISRLHQPIISILEARQFASFLFDDGIKAYKETGLQVQ